MRKIAFILFKIALIPAFLQLTLSLVAQSVNDTVYYNLKQLVILAQENNKDLQLAKLELQKTDVQVAIKKSLYLPKVDAFADYYWYFGDVPLLVFPESEGNVLSGGTSAGSYPVSVGLPNNLMAGVSLSQRLFDFSYLNMGKSKEVLSSFGSGKIKEKREQLIYDVAVCYYEILRLAAKQEFIDFNIERITRMIGILQIQFNNQMTDSLQMLDLDLKKSELLLSKSEFESGLQRKSEYLKMLTGLPDSIVIDYGTMDYAPALKIAPDSNNFEGSTQMNLLNQAQGLNDLSQKQVQSEYLPTLDLKFNLLWNSQSPDLGFFSNQAYSNNLSTLGLKLEVPIYHGGEKNKKMQELEINKHIIDIQKQKLKEGFNLQYSNSIKELDFKTARYLHQQEVTQLKKRYLEKANHQFEQGILPVKELIEAQSGLMEAQMKSAELLFDVKLAELEYFKWSNQILSKFE